MHNGKAHPARPCAVCLGCYGPKLPPPSGEVSSRPLVVVLMPSGAVLELFAWCPLLSLLPDVCRSKVCSLYRLAAASLYHSVGLFRSYWSRICPLSSAMQVPQEQGSTPKVTQLLQ